MAAAYDHSDHNAPAIRHCDVIAYYRSFVSCSCVRIRSGVSHDGLPWLRPTQVQFVRGIIRGWIRSTHALTGYKAGYILNDSAVPVDPPSLSLSLRLNCQDYPYVNTFLYRKLRVVVR
ncbi:PREDICTED: uncharacterized protein LOC108754382 [Trachymyrmex septentrionalis]|uniref:uncharacterized protein LOC108754382 n=1 Tax=Trachymyrmex septentrionalis TaxID=34720 RepID=UPI00084ED691|nr:PREDICTED: uncharacterized protein LOC108754382 [Trachymyrmex septentrionalis]